ncbi:Vmc-like lipoprotein signal peptide domain-containing protein [Mycoplasma anserisalpingitidis]|uniref:Variable surface lipoprotein n=1 Tax=Mycoplasma anserisalpingitidis TaxID=519450 RepID=A0A5B8K5R0_9MOLU|nr:hypothetical protein [Mycoplasma anserisalpingitidis]QDY88345.1 hypothetical protein FOY43_01545 [Mycoplasma anserisalpingitidis]
MKIKSKIKLISIFSIPVATLSLTSIAASCTNENKDKTKPETPENPNDGTQVTPETPENPETNKPVTPSKPNDESNKNETSNTDEEVAIVIKTLKGLRSTPTTTFENSNNTEELNSYRVITYAKENKDGRNVNVQYLVNSVAENVNYLEKLSDQQLYVYEELLKERKSLIDLAYKSPEKIQFQDYNAYQFKNKLTEDDSLIYPIFVSKFIYTIDFMLKDPGYLTKENLEFIIGDRNKKPGIFSELNSISVLESRIRDLLK